VVAEALGVRWVLAGPQEAVAGPAEHQAGLDLVLLDPAGDGQDLLDPAPAPAVAAQEDDQVDGGRDGGQDEAVGDVLTP
jgi:hypothetical protein